MAKKTRTFQGKKYQLYGSGSKRHTTLLAKQRRSSGHSARVVKSDGKYAVYVRKGYRDKRK